MERRIFMETNTNNTQNFSNGGGRQNIAYVWLNPEYNTQKTSRSGKSYIDGTFGTAIIYYRGLCIRGVQIRVSKAGDTYLNFPSRPVYQNGQQKIGEDGYPEREDYIAPTSREVRQEIQALVDAAIEKKMAEMQQNQ